MIESVVEDLFGKKNRYHSIIPHHLLRMKKDDDIDMYVL